MSYWARAWAAGWRVYAPCVPCVYHLWSRAHRPTFREWSNPATQRSESISRAAVLAQLQPESCIHSDTCVHAFLASVGLDFGGKTMTEAAKFGGLTADDFAAGFL